MVRGPWTPFWRWARVRAQLRDLRGRYLTGPGGRSEHNGVPSDQRLRRASGSSMHHGPCFLAGHPAGLSSVMTVLDVLIPPPCGEPAESHVARTHGVFVLYMVSGHLIVRSRAPRGSGVRAALALACCGEREEISTRGAQREQAERTVHKVARAWMLRCQC